MPTDIYSIGDLARLTGVNVRTIRYYLAQGLIPASGENGPGAHYGEGHLDRLRLTKRLQQQHLPLAEIRRRLAELSDADVASVIATAEPLRASPATSALDYVRSVLGGVTTSAPDPAIAPSAPAIAPATARPSAMAPAASEAAPAHHLRRAAYASIGIVSEEIETHAMPVRASQAPAPERSQWERLALSDNIELHIRRPLGRLEQRRVERLLTIARQVLKEEKP